MTARIQADLAIAAAEDYAHGYRCLRVTHGEITTTEDDVALRRLQDALEDLPRLLGGHPTQLARLVKTRRSATWWWASTPDLEAQQLVDQALQFVASHRLRWSTSQDPS